MNEEKSADHVRLGDVTTIPTGIDLNLGPEKTVVHGGPGALTRDALAERGAITIFPAEGQTVGECIDAVLRERGLDRSRRVVIRGTVEFDPPPIKKASGEVVDWSLLELDDSEWTFTKKARLGFRAPETYKRAVDFRGTVDQLHARIKELNEGKA